VFVILSYMLCLSCSQPSDPNQTDSEDGDEDKGRDEPKKSYAQLCLLKVFSLDIHAYLKKEAGQNVFSDFTIHCVMAGTPRWGNTFIPRVGRWTTVSGEIVGEYKVNKHESLCIIVYDFAPAPAAAKDDDSPMPPTGSSNTQTTPRYDKLCANISYRL
jgi:hypothetical protein